MPDPLKVLDQLGDELERLARADAARRSRRRRRRTIALGTGIAAALSGVALAATGLLTGEPVENPRGFEFRPDRGLGVPLPGSARLSALRVADPGGGPPWGLRTVRTSRGYGCVQVGRVVDGRLGVLGQDGAFDDDGRFHPLPADVLTQAFCERPDAAGNVFVAVSYRGLPASGSMTGCAPRETRSRGISPCPRGDLRVLYFGLLGPRAQSVVYAAEDGRATTAATSGRGGAYLVVRRPSRSRPADGQFVQTTSPGSGLAAVRYRGSPTCRIRDPRAIGGAKLCPRVGYVDGERRRVTSADVAAPVRARYEGGRVKISFRARVRADASAYYVFEIRPDGVRACGFSAIAGPVARDVTAGEVVSVRPSLPSTRCRGRVRGRVVFHVARKDEGALVPAVPLPGDALVGRFSVVVR